MRRALFITHDVSIYGASRSLQAITSNYKGDLQIDLAINKSFRKKNNKAEISRLFSIEKERIFEFSLPFSFCWVGKPNISLGARLKNLLAWLTRGRLQKFITHNQYDFIYLNSLVLHPLVNKKNENYFIHVREVFDQTNPNAIKNLKRAKGIIFIDKATREAFGNEDFRGEIILNNPFDMRMVEKINDHQIQFSNESRTVISMIGQIHDGKGTQFIINSFLHAPNNKDALLVIVGKGDSRYIENCKKQVGDAQNVIFYGEETVIKKIYKISDFIIRGESFPCIGRTVYEGLYSGCEVIMPENRPGNKLGLEEIFMNYVHFYEPRNMEDLIRVLNNCIGRKITTRKYRSNIDEYMNKFDLFIKTLIDKSPAK